VAAAGVLTRPPVRAALGGISVATALSVAAISPAFTAFVLLKLSGVPLSEPKYDKKYGKRADYQKWKRETNKFFPKFF
jgi:steroid 5-alpha reductase family enzyme